MRRLKVVTVAGIVAVGLVVLAPLLHLTAHCVLFQLGEAPCGIVKVT